MDAFAKKKQAAQRGQPIELQPLGAEEVDDLTAKEREVAQLKDDVIDQLGVSVFASNGGIKDQYKSVPLAQRYEDAIRELDALQQENKIDIGLSLGDVEQPDPPLEMTKGDFISNYEYGDGDKNGKVQQLPCSREGYTVGSRWKSNSGVGATQGRDSNRATTAGAMLPMAADMLAYNFSHTLEKDGLVLWHGDTFNQPSSPAKCPKCGKFVGPGKPCAHCGHSGAFAAVYDTNTGESACFVEGCPGVVDGKPCSHQVGAMLKAQTLVNQGVYEDQLTTAVRDHASATSQFSQTAITAGDASYVLIKEETPETLTFGSADVADRAKAAFASEIRVDTGQIAEDDTETIIERNLGYPEMPAPTNSKRSPARHDPNFVVTKDVEETLQMIGGSLRLGYSPNARGMMGRSFGLYGPPGTGKNMMFEETAATLDLPYREIDLGRGADIQALIGEVVLETDGQGGTRSVAKLGPLGKALVNGEVVVLNEIIHTDPDSQTMLHQIAQDGIIQLHNPEGADQTYEVHPSSILGVTWNPKGGLQDRPSEALYSRLFSRQVGYPEPEEEQRRLIGWAQGQGLPDVDDDSTKRTVELLNDLRELARRGGVDVPPSFRDGQRFMTQWKLTGNVDQGLEQLRGLASQLDDHDLQWQEVTNLFDRHFGDLVS
jgi:MoxR-like ATPase